MDSSLPRRAFFDLLGKGATAVAVAHLASCVAEAGQLLDEGANERELSDETLELTATAGATNTKHIAMLLYPELTLLDLIGPHTCFAALGLQVHLVWKTRDLITSDSGVKIQPTTTFADCPKELEILFVPGSSKSTAAMVRDSEVLQFLRSRGERAKWVTSVCTGSLILGAAGLLKGYKATSHWSSRDLLPLLKAERVDARYVIDRNRITGAGVTSGIDFGLHVVELLQGRTIAEVAQLMLEYAPEPPFNAGEPTTAPPLVLATALAASSAVLLDGRLAVEEASRRL